MTYDVSEILDVGKLRSMFLEIDARQGPTAERL